MTGLKAPMPWFGGKSRVAAEVWRRFGDVPNYCEPFFGSGAVLLGRPHVGGLETVNDINGWLCNFWRAIQADPDGVAAYADWPVSELDLHARGDWLFYRPGVAEFVEKLRGDPDYYDVKSAGWWVWGQSCWIGSDWSVKTAKRRQLPQLGNAGEGVNRQLPHLIDAGKGVNRQRLHLGDAGTGVNRSPGTSLCVYFQALADRLRRVRICCGDWSRVCTPAVTDGGHGLTGIFFDPPYGTDDRADCYGDHEDRRVAGRVRDWCLEHAGDPLLRIALCGYEGEHDLPGWDCFVWKTRGGYANTRVNGVNDNGRRERIWFSPSCRREPGLFDSLE